MNPTTHQKDPPNAESRRGEEEERERTYETVKWKLIMNNNNKNPFPGPIIPTFTVVQLAKAKIQSKPDEHTLIKE